ncbi:MAG: MFS transporter [Candidatus Hodarchaeales archaeon]|jgi:MFS family permease
MNWNVKIAYIQSVAAAIGMGITQTAFAIYVTQGLGQTNFVLGNFFTTSGLASTIFVFPSGYFADKYRRDVLIRISFFFGILSQIALVFATTLSDPDITLAVLFLAQALGGLGWGLSGPAAQALIADSIESGDRSRVFAKMHFANLLASALGPFIAAGLTLILGDNWGMETLTNLIFMGAVCTILSYIAVFFASDNKALVSRVEKTDVSPNEITDSQINDQKIADPSNFTLIGRPFSYDVVVPTVIVISGIIIGFGAGATVAFFSVLFADPDIGYGLQPFFTSFCGSRHRLWTSTIFYLHNIWNYKHNNWFCRNFCSTNDPNPWSDRIYVFHSRISDYLLIRTSG